MATTRLADGNLPVFDTLTYNGEEFGQFTHVTGFTAETVATASGFLTSHEKFTLTAETWVSSSDRNVGAGAQRFVQDFRVEAMRAALTVIGGKLEIEGKSVGHITVNLPGGPFDVMKGPIPTVISQDVIGGGLTTKLTWSLVWHLPTCADAVTTATQGVMDYWYSVSWRIENGYTTRTAQGRLKIPQRLAAGGNDIIFGVMGGTPADSADRFRELAVPPPLGGFIRSYGPFVLSPDRSELDFTVIDTELGWNVPPVGVIRPPDVSYKIVNAISPINGMGLLAHATLAASYEIAKTGDPADAVKAYARLIEEKTGRCDAALNAFKAKNPKPKAGEPGLPARPLLVAFSASDDELYGRRKISISATWWFASSIADILGACGLWTQVAESNWDEWQASVLPSTVGVRGVAGLRFEVGTDSQVSLCRGAVPSPRNDAYPRFKFLDGILGGIFEQPTADRSWVSYNTAFQEDIVGGNALVRTLPRYPVAGGTSADEFGFFDVDTELGKAKLTGSSLISTGGFQIDPQNLGGGSSGSGSDDGMTVVTARAYPFRYFRLTGSATRAGLPPPRPKATTIQIDGQTADLIPLPEQGDYAAMPVATLPGFARSTELWHAEWDIRYVAKKRLGGTSLPVPPDPLV